ncbi:MAG: hypothetical protein AAF356_08445 [Planctomycetota bacterium]
MKQLATGAASYAADHADRLPGYSWRAGETRSVVGELAPVTFATDREAAAWQLTEILRRSSGRGVPGNDPDADSAGVFIRHDDRILAPARMSHVPLLDYLTDVQPEPIAASPMDRNLLRWQGDPVATLDGVPYAGEVAPGVDRDPAYARLARRQRWAFGSTYQTVPAAWTSDGTSDGLGTQARPEPGWGPVAHSPHRFAAYDASGTPTPDAPVRQRLFSEVSFPSGKVHMFKEFDRVTNTKAALYFADPSAQVNQMFFDGSVRWFRTIDANPAWHPARPGTPWAQRYVPLDTFPGPIGDPAALLDQRFRWTALGLRGIDYGGQIPGTPSTPGAPEDAVGDAAGVTAGDD